MKILSLSLLYIIITVSSASALTMEEAVTLALENNHKIKEQLALFKAQEYRAASTREAFKPDLNLGYSYAQRDNAYNFQTEEEATATIEARYNLFNGFIDTYRVKEAEALVDASAYQKKSVTADITYDVESTCIDLLRARKNLQVAGESIELLEQQKKDIELYYQQEMATLFDRLKVEAELAAARQDLLQAESDIRTSRDKLERIIGSSVEAQEISEIATPDDEWISYDNLIDEMLQNRSELKYLKAVKQSLEFNKKATEGEYFPTIDLSLSYNQLGDSIAPTGRDQLYDSETRGMITASWRLLDRIKRKPEVQAKEEEIRVKEEQIADLIDNLKMQLKGVVEEHTLGAGKVEVANKAIEQAEENFRVVNNRFRQKMATPADLLAASLELSKAKNEYNNAKYDLLEAIVKTKRIIERSQIN